MTATNSLLIARVFCSSLKLKRKVNKIKIKFEIEIEIYFSALAPSLLFSRSPFHLHFSSLHRLPTSFCVRRSSSSNSPDPEEQQKIANQNGAPAATTTGSIGQLFTGRYRSDGPKSEFISWDWVWVWVSVSVWVIYHKQSPRK